MTAHRANETRDLGVLTRDDGLRLLGSVSVGRIVFTARALPAVALVNFAIVDDEIVLRTGEETNLGPALHDSVVAFEADHVDHRLRSGWSVVVVGQASTVTDPQRIATLDALELPCWLNGSSEHYVVVRPDFVSGRILVPPDPSFAAGC